MGSCENLLVRIVFHLGPQLVDRLITHRPYVPLRRRSCCHHSRRGDGALFGHGASLSHGAFGHALPFLSHVFNPRTALLTAIVITIVIRPWDGHAEVVIGVIGVIGALVVIGAVAVIRAIAVNRRRDGNRELVEAAHRRLELSQLVGHIEKTLVS